MTEHLTGPEAGEPRVATDEAFSVEAHGINTIPLADRHGNARELFFVWAGANTNYIYLILGSLVVSFGLGFWPAVVAIVVAHSFYLLLGAAAIPGPKAGTATMVVSRGAFGVRGNRPYAFLSWLTTVGWEAVFIVVATLALVQLAGLAHLSGLWVKIASLVIIAAATFVVAIFGHATIVVDAAHPYLRPGHRHGGPGDPGTSPRATSAASTSMRARRERQRPPGSWPLKCSSPAQRCRG